MGYPVGRLRGGDIGCDLPNTARAHTLLEISRSPSPPIIISLQFPKLRNVLRHRRTRLSSPIIRALEFPYPNSFCSLRRSAVEQVQHRLGDVSHVARILDLDSANLARGPT